ncbi:MAG: DUF3368 domain-containing protein [Promethearchaeota archaeon]
MTEYSYISDTTPLIAFIKKKALDILKRLFKKIYIPKAVFDELFFLPKKQEEQVQILKEAIKEGWIIVKQLKNIRISDLNVGKGETEAINMCFEFKNPLLLMDEKKGRNIARTFKIQTLGTLGILVLSKNKGYKTKETLLDNLDILLKKNFYISSEVITMFLKQID